MFSMLTQAVKQLFSGFTMFFLAFENVGKVAVVLTEVGVQTSEMYSDEARITRAKRLAELNAELKLVESTATKSAKVAAAA